MGHVLIAYDLFVIMIGLAALSIAGFWAVRSREGYLRDFCILYALFTLVMIDNVLIKYSALNLAGGGGYGTFVLAGINMALSSAVVVASIHFFHGIYRVRAGRVLSLAALAAALASLAVLVSPAGVVYRAGRVEMQAGALAALGIHNLLFAYALAVGFGLLGRVWKSAKRPFVIGLLVFASIGFVETLLGFISSLREPAFRMAVETDLLVSSIPYALYGIFVVYYFLQYTLPAAPEAAAGLFSRFGITEREQEIILKVNQGKSNAAIAAELFISLATVKTHLNNIYKKMGVDGRFDLISRLRGG